MSASFSKSGSAQAGPERPFFKACEDGNISEVNRCMASKEFDINARDKSSSVTYKYNN